jgi:subtilisin family serine protease
MKKILILLFVMLLCYSLIAYEVKRGERPAIDLDNIPAEAYEAGRLKIKLHSFMETIIPDEFIVAERNEYVQTGVAALDELNRHYAVTQYKPVFSSLYEITGKTNQYRERHKAWGFHLWFEIEIDKNADVVEAVKQYSSLSEVEIAEPVYIKRLVADEIKEVSHLNKTDMERWTPNDPRFNEQWHYHNTGQQSGTVDKDIDLPEAWEIEKGHTSVIVSVQDGGIQTDHSDLAGNMWSGIGYNFVTGSSTIEPHYHGTHVAGTVSAVNNNGIGVAGVAGGTGTGNGVRLMTSQVFTNSSSGGFHLAPVHAADNDAAISQNSWGYTTVGAYDQNVLDAIDYFNTNGGGVVLNGGITIYAAGNNGSEGAWYPGCYSGAFSVAATNNQDIRSNFGGGYGSNYGTWVDISAPGGETYQVTARGVLSTYTGNTYNFLQGTSMACPHASGVAALIISYAYRNGVVLNNSDVANILRDTTDDHYDVNPGYIGKLGTGRLNANAALLETASFLGGMQNPQTLTATPISTSQINLGWTKNTDNNSVMLAWSANGTFGIPSNGTVYSAGNSIPGGGTVLYRGALTSYNHTSLNAATTYYYKAFSYNASNEYSSGRNANATTDCGAITTFPFNEGFEGGTLPTCWTYDGTPWAYQAGGNSGNPSGAHSGSFNAFFFNASFTPLVSKLITPQLDFTGYTPATLTFWHAQVLWPDDQDELRIYYKTSSGGSWVQLAAYTENISAWTQRTISLPNLTNNYFIAFEATAKYGYGVVLDDIQITATPISENPPVAVVTPESFTKSIQSEATASDNLNISNTGGENLTYQANISYIPPAMNSQRAYCTTNYTNTTDDWITRVRFNTIDNSSGSVGYENFTGISTEVFPGESYELIVNIQVQGAWRQHCWVWFDWNQNEVFTDAGEAFDLGDNGGITGPYQFSQMITIPATATLGSTRMRIAERYSVDPLSCTVATYGEAEDYTIVIADSNPMTWLSFSGQPSVSGTVIPANNVNIPVNFNAAGLALGTYQAQINVTTNAPSNPSIQVMVTLNVEELVELLPPSNVTIDISGGIATVSWDAVSGANSYYIYSASEPNPVSWGSPIGQTQSSVREFSEAVSGSKKFYVVRASTDSYSGKNGMGTSKNIVPLK